MGFEKGNSLGKGRPKGSSNKSTAKIRNAFSKLLEDNLDQLEEDFSSLKPEQRIKYFIDLSKYVVPQLKQTEFKADEDGTLTIPVIKFTKSGDKDK